MQQYTLTGAAADGHAPEHPERTARRNAVGGAMQFDVVFQVWSNRAAMLRSIELQMRAGTPNRWREAKPARECSHGLTGACPHCAALAARQA